MSQRSQPFTFGAAALCLLVLTMYLVDCLHATQVQAFEISLPAGKPDKVSDETADSLLSKILIASKTSRPSTETAMVAQMSPQIDEEKELKRFSQAAKKRQSYALKKKLHKLVDNLIDEQTTGEEDDQLIEKKESSKHPANNRIRKRTSSSVADTKTTLATAATPLITANREVSLAKFTADADLGADDKIFILLKKPPTEQDYDFAERSRHFSNEHLRDLANDKFGIREEVRKMKSKGLIYGNIKENQILQTDESL